MHTQESGQGMKRLKNVKMRKILAFMVSLALMVSCMPSAYTISADEILGDETEELFSDDEDTSVWTAEEITPDVKNSEGRETEQQEEQPVENPDQDKIESWNGTWAGLLSIMDGLKLKEDAAKILGFPSINSFQVMISR